MSISITAPAAAPASASASASATAHATASATAPATASAIAPAAASATSPATASATASAIACDLHNLYLGRARTLQASPPSDDGALASDQHGAFAFTHTFDSAVVLGGALVLTCWLDADSVERGRFRADITRRPALTRGGRTPVDEHLPCITGYRREPRCAGARPPTAMSVALTLTTKPACFQAGDQLVLSLTLVAPKGSEAIMKGKLYFGPAMPGTLTFTAQAGAPAGAATTKSGATDA